MRPSLKREGPPSQACCLWQVVSKLFVGGIQHTEVNALSLLKVLQKNIRCKTAVGKRGNKFFLLEYSCL